MLELLRRGRDGMRCLRSRDAEVCGAGGRKGWACAACKIDRIGPCVVRSCTAPDIGNGFEAFEAVAYVAWLLPCVPAYLSQRSLAESRFRYSADAGTHLS
jgi:hypothetical protein